MINNFWLLAWEVLRIEIFDVGPFSITPGVVVASWLLFQFATILWGRFTNAHFLGQMEAGQDLGEYIGGFGFLHGQEWVDDMWEDY